MNDEEKRVDLEGVLYNEDGSFMPFHSKDGNEYEELSHLRNTYMEAERDYLEHLLTNEKMRSEFFKFLDYDANDLFNEAIRIQEKIESGDLETEEEKIRMQEMTPQERAKFHMDKLEDAEGLMCLLFAAAKDKKAKVLELIDEPSVKRR